MARNWKFLKVSRKYLHFRGNRHWSSDRFISRGGNGSICKTVSLRPEAECDAANDDI
jgi:hypothetical protein